MQEFHHRDFPPFLPGRVLEFHHRDFPAGRVLEWKAGRSVSVCIPARNEESTVGAVVEQVLLAGEGRRPLVDEVVVIDDCSEDDTSGVARSAGAKVVTALPGPGLMDGPGKGAAMKLGLESTCGEIVIFLDADVENTGPHFVTGLVGPLLAHPQLRIVKATYERALNGRPGEGGRVTELVAKPLIGALFPALAFLGQPLSGECAGWREAFGVVDFPRGYGVELAVIADVARAYGAGSIAQVNLGTRVHRNRPLGELAPIARDVLDAALQRAGITEDHQ